MAEVVKNSAELTLKGLCSQNSAEVEAARHQAERLSGDEFLRLLHLFEKGLAKAQMGELGPPLAMTLLILFGGLITLLILTNPGASVRGAVPLILVLTIGGAGLIYRSRYHKEDWDEISSRLNNVLNTTQSTAIAEAVAQFLVEKMRQATTGRKIASNSVLDYSARQVLMRVLPTMETATGWKRAGRQALYELIQEDTQQHKLASCILETAARWRDLDALPQISKLAKREDTPSTLRHFANEIRSLLLAEQQRQQTGKGLLRASETPQAHSRQELLRPASGHSETPQDELLRPQA